MSPPLNLTQEQINGMIADAVKSATGGMTPEDFNAFRAWRSRAQEREDETRREQTKDLIFSNAATKSYAEKARHIIEHDTMKGAGLYFARFVRALAAEQVLKIPAEVVAEKAYDDPHLAELIKAQREASTKALTAQTASSGGILIPPTMEPEIIELLRASSVMRQAGCRQIGIPNGTLNMGRQTGAATAAYTGESTNITQTSQAFDAIQLVARKLTALTVISNELLRCADAGADQIVRDDLGQVMALRGDLAFLRGDGTSGVPKGVRYRTQSGNVVGRTQAAGTGSTTAEVTLDGFKMQKLVAATNVDISTGFYVFHSNVKYALMQYREANSGALAFAAELMQGRWLGFPYFISNQIPTTLGGGDESEVYFCVANECVIGDKSGLIIDVQPGAAYHDGSNVQASFSRDETPVRAIEEHDFVMRHVGSAAVLTTVDWPS